MDNDAPGAAATPAVETPAADTQPSYIKLLEDWGSHLAGKVLHARDDLIAALEKDGIKFRDAFDHERRLAGFHHD